MGSSYQTSTRFACLGLSHRLGHLAHSCQLSGMWERTGPLHVGVPRLWENLGSEQRTSLSVQFVQRFQMVQDQFQKV